MGVGRISTPLWSALAGRFRAARECALWLLRLRTRHRVVNSSMEPTAKAGDFLLVNPGAYCNSVPAPGDIVLARHPWDSTQMITKRVSRVGQDDVELVSDNPEQGQDSRSFGRLPLSQLCGQVTYIIR